MSVVQDDDQRRKHEDDARGESYLSERHRVNVVRQTRVEHLDVRDVHVRSDICTNVIVSLSKLFSINNQFRSFGFVKNI